MHAWKFMRPTYKKQALKAGSYKMSSRNILNYDFFVILGDVAGKAAEQKARENIRWPRLKYFLRTFSMNRPLEILHFGFQNPECL